MPESEPTPKHTPIPAGDHVLTLISVEEQMRPTYNNPSVDEPRWTWQFKAVEKNPETGESYEFRIYSGRYYGNPKATLTLLLDMMLPNWTTAQKERINTDTILSSVYRARIRHEAAEKAGDPPKPRLVYIEPFKKGVAGKKEVAAPPAGDDVPDLDASDPFADQ